MTFKSNWYWTKDILPASGESLKAEIRNRIPKKHSLIKNKQDVLGKYEKRKSPSAMVQSSRKFFIKEL